MEKTGKKGIFDAIGTQKLVAIGALVVLFIFFSFAGSNFCWYSTFVNILITLLKLPHA